MEPPDLHTLKSSAYIGLKKIEFKVLNFTNRGTLLKIRPRGEKGILPY